jgi:hypothetical protein
MKRLGVVCALALTGCAHTHVAVWKASDVAVGPYHKILACSLSKETDVALALETAMMHAFAPYPVLPGTCTKVLPRSARQTADQMAASIRRGGYDAVLVAEREPLIRWKSGSDEEDIPDASTLSDFLDAYAGGYAPEAASPNLDVAISHSRGGDWRHVKGSFRLYDAATGRLVWKARGTAQAPKELSVERSAEEVAAENVELLAQGGVIPPASHH